MSIFLPDTQAFGSGQRIRSSHSLQEIRPGLVEELAPDGETLGSVTVTHIE